MSTVPVTDDDDIKQNKSIIDQQIEDHVRTIKQMLGKVVQEVEEEPLPLDTTTTRQTMHNDINNIVDTRTIALIASKRNFNPDKERLLIEKAKTTKCKCHNFTNTEPCCFYRNCRHTFDTHYKGVMN